jgi:hypothetical protein
MHPTRATGFRSVLADEVCKGGWSHPPTAPTAPRIDRATPLNPPTLPPPSSNTPRTVDPAPPPPVGLDRGGLLPKAVLTEFSTALTHAWAMVGPPPLPAPNDPMPLCASTCARNSKPR